MSEKEIQALKGRFGKEPYAKKLGIKIIEIGEGYAYVEMKVTEQMGNIFGMAHGGALFSLIDAAFELAGNSRGVVSVALNMSVTYTYPARPGDVLRAKTKEINLTRKTGLYEIQVINQDGKLVATSQALLYRKEQPLPWL